jgi:CP family cyanate transporter-like MFS transporter
LPPFSGRTLFPAAILLVGLNLRPLLASVGPLLDTIQHDTALGDTGASLLTAVPVMLMGLCLLGTGRVQALLGPHAGILLGMVLIATACLGRLIVPDAPMLIGTAILGGMGIATVQALMPAVIRRHYGARAAGMMGLYSTAIMGGALLASFASPRIAPHGGWPVALGLWGGPALLGMGLWQGARLSQARTQAPRRAPHRIRARLRATCNCGDRRAPGHCCSSSAWAPAPIRSFWPGCRLITPGWVGRRRQPEPCCRW